MLVVYALCLSFLSLLALIWLISSTAFAAVLIAAFLFLDCFRLVLDHVYKYSAALIISALYVA